MFTGFYAWWTGKPAGWPMGPYKLEELVTKINDIKDIEHLRKVTLLLVRQHNAAMRDANELLAVGVKCVLWIGVLFSVMQVFNALFLFRLQQQSQGTPVKWLRWL
jgi:hypothetical protein